MSIELQALLAEVLLIGAIYLAYKAFRLCIKTAFNKGVKSVLSNIPDCKTDYPQHDSSKSAIYKPYSTRMFSEETCNQGKYYKENTANSPQNKHPLYSLTNIFHKCIIKKVKSLCQLKKNDTLLTLPLLLE